MTRTARIRTITLGELCKRSGIPFVDGRQIQLGYDPHGRTVQRGDHENSGPVHRHQQRFGQKYFTKRGYRLFPYQIGVKQGTAMADFAVARYKRVILVECLTDLQPTSEYVLSLQGILQPTPTLESLMQRKILHKCSLATQAELWFVVQALGKSILQEMGYVCRRLPCPRMQEFQASLDPTFWLCEPPDPKRI